MEWQWPDLIRVLADLVAAIAAIIAAKNARRARKSVQALLTQQQTQTIQQHQYFGPVYQTESVGQGQEASRIQFELGESPPGQGDGPNDATCSHPEEENSLKIPRAPALAGSTPALGTRISRS